MDGEEVGKELCRVDETKNPTPPPIFGLPCHDKCKDGESASVSLDQTKLDYFCDKCPANTYSIGEGGIRIDGAMGAFNFHGEDGNVMPLQMTESCQVHATTQDINGPPPKNQGCTPWSVTGTSIKAY